MKNIFDFVGNLWEYTTEISTNENYPRIIRDCCANNSGHSGSDYSNVTIRLGIKTTDEGDWVRGFRTVLYVK